MAFSYLPQNMENPEQHSEADQIPKLTLEDRVRISFEQLGYPQLNAVHCVAEGDLMRLQGQLNSFYLKQVAQSVAVKTPGVRSVENEIEVI
ncbi:MAG: BON domain-containing protein [Planctomycetota bacterium]